MDATPTPDDCTIVDVAVPTPTPTTRSSTPRPTFAAISFASSQVFEGPKPNEK